MWAAAFPGSSAGSAGGDEMAMTMGKREYSEAEMMRMQRDAEERVREMQARARATVENDNVSAPPQRNRNWNSNPGRRRQNNVRPQQEPRFSRPSEPAPEPQQEPQPEPQPTAPPEPKKPTTIIEDIMGALGLDEDYLLIIGLLLILINQRADTTLILALAYLLI